MEQGVARTILLEEEPDGANEQTSVKSVSSSGVGSSRARIQMIGSNDQDGNSYDEDGLRQINSFGF